MATQQPAELAAIETRLNAAISRKAPKEVIDALREIRDDIARKYKFP